MKTAFFLIALIPYALLPRSAPLFAVEGTCNSCHENISSKKNVHPAMDMDCYICHLSPHEKEEPELSLMSEVPDLCYICHQDNVTGKPFRHEPAAAGTCTSCHDPHASEHEKLLKADPRELCYGCHDKKAFSKKYTHSPVAAGQCSACHNPHAADIEFDLNEPLGRLCVKCHEKSSSGKHVLAHYWNGQTHPVINKPDPSRKGSEISCVSCHNPHSSAAQFLFTNDKQSPEYLCLMCHTKIMVSPMR
jgi:predicted CXXCH cytochrome family protein